jgi:alpha-tubulin suppressor-like RCC1 family protein
MRGMQKLSVSHPATYGLTQDSIAGADAHPVTAANTPAKLYRLPAANKGVAMVACSLTMTLLLTMEGKLMYQGHMGPDMAGCTPYSEEFTHVRAQEDRVPFVDIACGSAHALALSRERGVVLAWGDNTCGQVRSACVCVCVCINKKNFAFQS